jgi:hypothetical protein
MAIDLFEDYDGYQYYRVRVHLGEKGLAQEYFPRHKNGRPLPPEEDEESKRSAEQRLKELLEEQKREARKRVKVAIPTKRRKNIRLDTKVRGITYKCTKCKKWGNVYFFPEFEVHVAEGTAKFATIARGFDAAWEMACKKLVELKKLSVVELDEYLARKPDQAVLETAIKEHLDITSFGSQGKEEDFPS